MFAEIMFFSLSFLHNKGLRLIEWSVRVSYTYPLRAFLEMFTPTTANVLTPHPKYK